MPSMDSAPDVFYFPSAIVNALNTADDSEESMFCTAGDVLLESQSSTLTLCDTREEACALRTCNCNLQGNTSSPSEFGYRKLGSLPTTLNTRKRAALCLGDHMLDAMRIDNRDILRGSDLTLKLAPPGDYSTIPIAILPSDNSVANKSLAMLVDATADVRRQVERIGNAPKLLDWPLYSTACSSFSCCLKDCQESSHRTAEATIVHAASARDEENCNVGHVKLPFTESPSYFMRFNEDTQCMNSTRKEEKTMPLFPDHLQWIENAYRNEGTTILKRRAGHYSRSGKCVRSVPNAECTLNECDFRLAMQIDQTVLQGRPNENGTWHIGLAPILKTPCTSTHSTTLLQPTDIVPKCSEAQDPCSDSQLGAISRCCSGRSRASASCVNEQNESPSACSSQRVIPANPEFWYRPMHSPKDSSVASNNENKEVSSGDCNVAGGDELRSFMTLVAASEVSDREPSHEVDVVGWPPVNSYRKTSTHIPSAAKAAQETDCRCATTEDAANCFFQPIRIKASMDGAWFMRKLDLRSMRGYHDLCLELENLFKMYFAANETQAAVADVCVDPSFQSEWFRGNPYVITYEDTEGDWMLAGDTPWEMFVQSVRKIRIMRKPRVVVE